MKTAACAVTTLALMFSSAVATAEPVAPQPDTPCPSNYADAMTMPGAMMPLVCQGGRWQTVATPAPPSDRWLSVGPAMTLHGEGRRNPDVRSGDWTATPQDSTSRCRADQSTVVSPGVVSPPQTAEGPAGQPLKFTMLPRLFDLTLSGDCLWTRTSG